MVLSTLLTRFSTYSMLSSSAFLTIVTISRVLPCTSTRHDGLQMYQRRSLMAHGRKVHCSYLFDFPICLTLHFSLGPVARVLEATLQSLSDGPVHFVLINNLKLLGSLASM